MCLRGNVMHHHKHYIFPSHTRPYYALYRCIYKCVIAAWQAVTYISVSLLLVFVGLTVNKNRKRLKLSKTPETVTSSYSKNLSFILRRLGVFCKRCIFCLVALALSMLSNSAVSPREEVDNIWNEETDNFSFYPDIGFITEQFPVAVAYILTLLLIFEVIDMSCSALDLTRHLKRCIAEALGLPVTGPPTFIISPSYIKAIEGCKKEVAPFQCTPRDQQEMAKAVNLLRKSNKVYETEIIKLKKKNAVQMESLIVAYKLKQSLERRACAREIPIGDSLPDFEDVIEMSGPNDVEHNGGIRKTGGRHVME